jgi:hypothetical protein
VPPLFHSQTQGFAGAAAAFSKPLADPDLLAKLSSLIKRPPQGGSGTFRAAMRRVLTETSRLDDVKKAIAEFWADGPDGTTPPGTYWACVLDKPHCGANGGLSCFGIHLSEFGSEDMTSKTQRGKPCQADGSRAVVFFKPTSNGGRGGHSGN